MLGKPAVCTVSTSIEVFYVPRKKYIDRKEETNRAEYTRPSYPSIHSLS